jgi:hypothetical protein
VITSMRRAARALISLALLVCSASVWPFTQEEKTPQDSQKQDSQKQDSQKQDSQEQESQKKESQKKEHDKNKQPQEKPYGLIFGTAYGPDDRPLYGVRVTIRREGKNHKTWEVVSDHRGEFAQRVPVEASDYVIKGEAEYAPVGPDGRPQMSKKKKLRGQTRVHIEGEERQDIGIHLQ